MSALPPFPPAVPAPDLELSSLVDSVRQWGAELGFSAVGIADLELAEAGERLSAWVEQGMHGEMDYMERHLALRRDPSQLVPAARSAIMVRMDYAPLDGAGLAARQHAALRDGRTAVVATYALGRDYHKVLRQRLQRLADRIAEAIGPFGYRVFTDSAPVMEVELARKAGLGWRGKHTLLLSREGSWFFLGEILTDLPLPADQLETPHCGRCRRCIEACPTGAIVAPYVLDARRCISYLTIELKGSIPEALRPAIGTHVYGCDDCQTACPWNKYARASDVPDFAPRHGLDAASLVELLAWTEREFDERTQGSAIRRIGYERWLRNVAVALGNAAPSEEARAALRARAGHPSELVREHVQWALARQREAE
ncbi:Epoxyqueuosine reductase [Pigmentiphaga humi]|uniref:Epoxyqueuosine reductase n=1 Tax=Pigmentiphaga humi TaxID=2478468 RepID=A0A3P4B4N4_9BURK|nr:tRNA epoxyqueuosine(34) reductase QueG [Pigmentiphaga humi]VCU71259.1 Epoxyqueuosine reductase [Pigmentiphaga humi]